MSEEIELLINVHDTEVYRGATLIIRPGYCCLLPQEEAQRIATDFPDIFEMADNSVAHFHLQEGNLALNQPRSFGKLENFDVSEKDKEVETEEEDVEVEHKPRDKGEDVEVETEEEDVEVETEEEEDVEVEETKPTEEEKPKRGRKSKKSE